MKPEVTAHVIDMIPARAARESQLSAVLGKLDEIIRRLTTPLGALLVTLLLSLAGGVFVHSRVYGLSIGIGAMIVTGLIWPWLTVLALVGSIEFASGRGREGQPVQVRIRLRNRLRLRLYGVEVQWEEGQLLRRRVLDTVGTLAAKKETLRAQQFIPPTRGEYPSGRIWVTCGFPFGLCTARRQLEVSAALLVWPDSHPLEHQVGLAGDRPSATQSLTGRVGSQGEIHGVRPYRRGDSLRRVHWAQTARHEQLIVCELQASSQPAIRLVLDLCIPSTTEEHLARFESAVRRAAGLAEEWLKQGAVVEFFAGHQQVAARGGQRQRTAILDALARVRPVESSGPQRATALALRPIARTTILVTTMNGTTSTHANPRHIVIVTPESHVRRAAIHSTAAISPGRPPASLARATGGAA